MPPAGAHRAGASRPYRRRRRRRALRAARLRPVGSRRTAIGSIRPSCWSTRLRRRSTGRSACTRRCSTATRPSPEDTARADAEGDCRRARCRRAVRPPSFRLGPARSSTNCMCAASPCPIPTFPPAHPRHLRRRSAIRPHRASAPPRRHHRRVDAQRRLGRRAAPAAARICPTTGATTRWRSWPPIPRLAPGGWAEVRAAVDALHAAGI